jgi:uncharacterized membrane protein YciS (DUF1049 family)
MLIVLGLVFASLNQQMVVLNYHVGRLQAPLAALIICSIILGVLISLVICAGSKLKISIENRKLNKTIKNLEQEVQNLRQSSTKCPDSS